MDESLKPKIGQLWRCKNSYAGMSLGTPLSASYAIYEDDIVMIVSEVTNTSGASWLHTVDVLSKNKIVTLSMIKWHSHFELLSVITVRDTRKF